MARNGLARENYRGRRVAFPAGAVLVGARCVALAPLAMLDDRADLDLLDPELRRWAVYVLGVALLGLARRRARARGRLGERRAAGAATRARSLRAASRPGRSRRSARWRSPRTRRPAAASEDLAYVARSRAAAADDQPVQPARPAARPGREGVRRCSSPASASARGPRSRLSAGPVHRAGRWSALVHPARARDAR